MSKTPSFRKVAKGLAGALAIASGTSAYGAIVQVNPPPDLMTSAGGPATSELWDVNGDGIFDFQFSDRYPNTAPGDIGVVWQLGIDTGSTNNGVLCYAGQFIRYAYALHYGDFIAPGDPRFSTAYGTIVLGSKYNYSSSKYGYDYYGGFATGKSGGGVDLGHLGFVGFHFDAADGTHYGWLRLSVNAGIIDFADAAYESVPNQGIGTAIDPPMPEPGTMALLVLGAVGVIGAVAKRRRT